MDVRKPLELSETYFHFDRLIWQVPSIGMAVAVGVVVAAGQIKDADGWVIPLTHVKGVVLLFGAILLVALVVALFKYRIFSSAATPRPIPRPPFGIWPSAGAGLQLATTLTSGLLVGLALTQFFGFAWFVWICFAVAFIAFWLSEKHFDAVRKDFDANY